MTRVIPEVPSTADVNLSHLLAVFITGQDSPITHTIADILAANPDNATDIVIISVWNSGDAAAAGQLTRSNSNKIFVCINGFAEGSAASQVRPEESANWQLITGFAGQWVSGDRYTHGSIVEHLAVPYYVRADIVNSVVSPPNDTTNFLSLANVGNRTRYTTLGTASFDLSVAGTQRSRDFTWAQSVGGTPQTFDAIAFQAVVGTDDVPFFIPLASEIGDGREHDVLLPEDTYIDRAHVGHVATNNSGRHLSLTLRPRVNAGNAVQVTAVGIDYGGQLGSGGGVTNLAIGTRTSETVVIESDTGTDATLPRSTDAQAGLQTAQQNQQHNALPLEWSSGVFAVGEQRAWAGRVYECVVARTGSDTQNPAADTVGWQPLSRNRFTAADETKLDGIEDGATADQSIGEIIDGIEAETGDDRLDASRLRNHPQASTTQPGNIEVATAAEGDTGTDSSRAMTPAGVRRQTGVRVSAAERTATTPGTSVRRFSVADIVAIVQAHAPASGLNEAQVLALFLEGARATGTARIPANRLDTDVVLSAELTAAIASFRSETQINALITAALNNLNEVTNAGPYAIGTAYTAGALVRHGGNGTQASYLCIQDIGANIAASEPGVGADWRTSWYRVGYEDGPPNAIVDLTVSGRTVTATREGGTNPLELNFPITDRTERGERITNRAQASGSTSVEARPIATDPLSVVHGEGANSILSGVSGNDVTVAAGLYAVVMEVTADPGTTSGATRDRTFRFDIRDASDNSVLARSTSPALFGTRANEVSALAFLNLNADTAVNHLIERSGDLAFAANYTITYYRWGENEDTGVGNVQTVEIGRYTVAADQTTPISFADTGIAAPTDIDPEDTFLFTYEEALVVNNLTFSGRQLLAAERREAGSTQQTGTLELSTVSDSYNVTRNAAGNFVIAAFNDQLYAGQTYIFEILRAPRGERGPAGAQWGPPTDLGTATFDLDGNVAQIALTDGNGNAIVAPADGYLWFFITVPTLGLVGNFVQSLAADIRAATMNDALSGGLYTNADQEILFSAAAQTGASVGNRIIVQHLPGTSDQSDTGQDILPSIARFDLEGDLTPNIGNIGGNRYTYDAAISQSGHASAARIVGFAGTALEPSAVAVLATLTNLHSETGTITIPAGVSLAAAGDVYTVRLEVYTAGQDPATDQPRIYHDARIVARAVAATVHFGFIQDSEEAAAVDFATDDILTRGAVAGDYTVSGIPTTGDFRLYWAVPQSLAQPRNWLVSGFNVNSGIVTPPVARTVDGVAYNFYLTVEDAPFDSSGNGTTYTLET